MTPMLQAALEMVKKIDKSATDQKTNTLMETWGEIVSQGGSVPLTADNVAVMVKDIILGKITSFRCQATAGPLMNAVIAAKLKDVASNEPIELVAKQFSDAK